MKRAEIINKIRPVLSALGYYFLKSNIKQFLFLQKIKKEDRKKKKNIDIAIASINEKLSFPNNRLIVSLTSYGKRITDTLPYTLYSLITQDVLPWKIAVFISNEEYASVEELPAILQKLDSLGVSFYFVEDLKSYKKLYFSLSLYPDNPILTVDDDSYYHSSLISMFLNEYANSDKKTVIGTIGRYEKKKPDGTYQAYSEWTDTRYGSGNEISFYGVGGCLYPPHIFDDEVLNKSMFMRLAPTADDLWFWAMEKRCRIPRRLIHSCNQIYIPVNRISLYKLEGSLTFINDIQKNNDIQLNNLIQKYNI